MYPHTMNPGDLVSRNKGLVIHYGIVVTPSDVLEIVPQSTPRVVPLEHFASGERIRLQRPHVSDRAAIVARAWQVASARKFYDIATYNCEHVKNYVLTGFSYSESVRTVLGLILAVSAIACIARVAR